MDCVFERCYVSEMSGACLTLPGLLFYPYNVTPSLGFGVGWWAAAVRSNSRYWKV